MRTILITGYTGAGKSSMISDLGKGLRLLLIDPLAQASGIKKSWAPPILPVDVVVFDHTQDLASPAIDVASALAWCRQYRANLVLITMCPRDLKQDGIDVHIDTAVELQGPPTKSKVTVTTGNEIVTGSMTACGLTEPIRTTMVNMLSRS